MQNSDIDAEHAKAVAAANGIRITAASVSAAQRLLERQGAPTEIGPPKDKPAKAVAKARPGRPARRPEANLDVEALIRATAERIQTQGNVEADRLRDAMRQAIGALQAAVASPALADFAGTTRCGTPLGFSTPSHLRSAADFGKVDTPRRLCHVVPGRVRL